MVTCRCLSGWLLVSNLYGSRQSRDMLQSVVAVTLLDCFQFIWIPTESGLPIARCAGIRTLVVSNLYGSRQSRDSRLYRSRARSINVVSNLYGSRQSRDPRVLYLLLRLIAVSNLYGSRQSRDTMSEGNYVPLDEAVSNLYGSRQSRDARGNSLAHRGSIWFPIYMDPDRVGTLNCLDRSTIILTSFQFIWIPTESGRRTLAPPLGRRFLVSNLYGSRQSRDCRPSSSQLQLFLFPIYMDPDRVGTMRVIPRRLNLVLFPIYMDPDRVGTV